MSCDVLRYESLGVTGQSLVARGSSLEHLMVVRAIFPLEEMASAQITFMENDMLRGDP